MDQLDFYFLEWLYTFMDHGQIIMTLGGRSLNP